MLRATPGFLRISLITRRWLVGSKRAPRGYHLGPLGDGESRAYVEHRLRRADWKGDPHFA